MTRAFWCAVLSAGLAGAAQAQLAIVSNLPGNFIDISGSGALIPAGDDTAHQLTNTIGNAIFPAGGWVNSNGTLTPVEWSAFSNDPLPWPTLGSIYAPFWDDLNPGTGGSVRWQQLSDRVIVQWTEVPFFGSPFETVTFQAQVFASGPIMAQYLYAGAMTTGRQRGDSATIGAQVDGLNAAPWSWNVASLQPGMVLSVVVPAPGSVALLGMGGLLAMRRRRWPE